MNRHSHGAEPAPRSDGVPARPGDGPGPVGRKSGSRDSSGEVGSLREHVDRSPRATAVLDGETYVIRYVNDAFRRLSGIDAPLLGRPIAAVLPSSSAPGIATLLRQVHDTGEALTEVAVEGDVVTEPLPLEPAVACLRVTIWPVPENHLRQRHLVLQLRDATDEMRAEHYRTELVEQLREINKRLLLATLREEELRRQAQAANESKSAFLATMSHELRTPLTAVIGYEELLASGITGPITDAQGAQLGRIKRSAGHLLSLIDEVLTYARVEAHREVVTREPVTVAQLVDAATTLITPLAEAKGLAFAVHAPERPLTLSTDPLKARQILVNLLGNAVKFTARGEIALAVREDGEAVIFQVRDTGIGIAPEHLDRIFDPFWQVQQKPTRTVGGTGLGLSVAHRLARLLGGDVTAESTVGEGSTFTLRLPRDGLVAERKDGASGT